MDWVLITGIVASGIRFAMPILFAALGETVSQRSGMLNVGLEGIMLVGAFLAVLFAVITGSPWVGLGAAAVGGLLLGLVHGVFSIKLKVDQIVSGIAMILLGLGLSGYGYRLYFGTGSPGQVPRFERLDLGPLSDIPILGPMLFSHYTLTYIAIAAAIALAFLLKRTGAGLTIRAVGENPEAADNAGINVDRVRMICVAFGGMMAGIGGAYLSTAQLGGFVENMVSGRGFIAIACVVFARWNPPVVLAATLVFGMADATQIRLQTLYPEIPYQFFIILPFVLAIVALAATSRSMNLPAALGRPYRSE